MNEFHEVLKKWALTRSHGKRMYLHDRLAKDSGLSQSAALSILSGRREPKWKEAIHIAHAFGTSLEGFLTGPDKPDEKSDRSEAAEARAADRELMNEALGKPISITEEVRRKRLKKKLFSGYLDA